MKIFAEITKRDDEERMVYGYASTEAMDVQGEIVTKAAIEAALPEYLKFGNVREMHQPSAVGIAKQADMDDKGLYLAAKIVDDTAWKKVKEGVYKGFSIGGKSLQKADGVISKLRLSEISLVDRPANPEARIDLFKADLDGDFVGDKPDIAKYAGEEIWDAKRAIEALSTIHDLLAWESREGEPPEQADALRIVVGKLKEFIASEILEDNSTDAAVAAAVRMADAGGDIAKAGARNSKSDQERIQAMHDHAAALGASCGAEKLEKAEDADPAIDSLVDILNKGDIAPARLLELAQQEVADMKKIEALESDIQKLQADNDLLKAEIEELKKLPAAPKGSLKAVEKGDDIAGIEASPVEPVRKWNGEVDEEATAIKKILAAGPLR